MKSVYNFVVKPVGKRYNNVKKVGDKELIVNTEIFNHQYVNRQAKVIKNTDKYTNSQEQKNIGIIKYTDGTFKVGDLVGFEPFSTYDFVIDNQRLYRVHTKFITIKYEYQGNEEAYNPSWAQSS
jgi:hypothetical protein